MAWSGVSNLPRGPDGNFLPGTGRAKGSKNKLPKLARQDIYQVFDNLGGVTGMTRWANLSSKNLYAFYVYIFPRLMGNEPRITNINTRPQITKIETVIIDPKNDYKHDLDGVPGSPIDREGAVDSEPVTHYVREEDESEVEEPKEDVLIPGEIIL